VAVLINDFEIVLDPPASERPPRAGMAPPEPPAAPAAIRPADLVSVALHVARRRERLRAH
jgi:hypothetical protein